MATVSPQNPYEVEFDKLTRDELVWRDALDLIDPIFGDPNDIIRHAQAAPRKEWGVWLLLSLGEMRNPARGFQCD